MTSDSFKVTSTFSLVQLVIVKYICNLRNFDEIMYTNYRK